ncbi:hypothetical protein GCM10028806_26310 [Spirosoma terrae]|uniref:hypothetical protein n=1 Tax=Spirosoma terrae TaxID=1968276 RepID=UPI0014787A0B|nr:hypothetical protein [Spirosoma terrae]
MKKQFAIKAAQTSKNIVLSAAKKETNNLMKFMLAAECCQFTALQGTAPKTAFSL